MLIFGLILVLVAIWVTTSVETVALKPFGAIAAIIGIYIIARYSRKRGP
jgi:uncharacterized membrane protein